MIGTLLMPDEIMACLFGNNTVHNNAVCNKVLCHLDQLAATAQMSTPASILVVNIGQGHWQRRCFPGHPIYHQR